MSSNQNSPYKIKSIYSWALYDWANSAFATTVIAGFFPIFFKEFWSPHISASASTFVLGLANSGSGLAFALIAPFLGAVADHGWGKKKFLFWMTLIGSLFTMGLYEIPAGQWTTAAWVYGITNFAFAGALTFYDALILDVSPPEKMDQVSSLGYGLGYLGGGLLFSLNVLMTLHPDWLGLSHKSEAVRWSFVSVGVWWLIFSLPLFLWVKERYVPSHRPTWRAAWTQGWSAFIRNMRGLKNNRPLLIFLVAYILYIDGVNTVIRMAVDYGMALGFSSQHLIGALLMVQFIGFPAALAFGFIGEKWGARQGIFICLWVYTAVVLLAFLMTQPWHFYVMAGIIGLVQGGVQALSRSFFARMIPPTEAGEFFGFFNLVGKFSAIISPLLMGVISLMSGQPRWSILVLLVMFLAGGLLLRKVHHPC